MVGITVVVQFIPHIFYESVNSAGLFSIGILKCMNSLAVKKVLFAKRWCIVLVQYTK